MSTPSDPSTASDIEAAKAQQRQWDDEILAEYRSNLIREEESRPYHPDGARGRGPRRTSGAQSGRFAGRPGGGRRGRK